MLASKTLITGATVEFVTSSYLPCEVKEAENAPEEPEVFEEKYNIEVFEPFLAEQDPILQVPVESVIQRMGAKSQLAPWLVERFPRNVKKYVEPFGGSFKVLLAKPFRHSYELINDIDADLIHFFRYVRAAPQLVADFINDLPTHEALMMSYRWRLGRGELTGLERAVAVFLNSRAMFNAKTLSGTNFAYSDSIFSGINIYVEADKLHKLAERLRGVSIRSTTVWRLLGATIKKVPGGIFFYLDPPYDETEGYTTAAGVSSTFGKAEQARLAEHCALIHQTGNLFIQTNSDTTFLRELYGSYKNPDGSPMFYMQSRMVFYSIGGTAETTGDRSELIISNFPLEGKQKGLFT